MNSTSNTQFHVHNVINWQPSYHFLVSPAQLIKVDWKYQINQITSKLRFYSQKLIYIVFYLFSQSIIMPVKCETWRRRQSLSSISFPWEEEEKMTNKNENWSENRKQTVMNLLENTTSSPPGRVNGPNGSQIRISGTSKWLLSICTTTL